MKLFARISFLVCMIGVFALFVRTAAFSYIGLDDAAYTFRNPFVAGGLSFGNVFNAFTNLRHGGIWMPVTYISYMLDASICRIAGLPLIGEMHVVNVLLHVINFLLLWKLISAFAAHQPPTANYQLPTILSALAAVVWAVHPLRVEPVAWVAARKELLWTLFTLVGLICWRDSRRWPWAYLCCALACLSKPTAMCFPFLAAVIGWQQGWRRFRYLPLLAMAAATAAIAAYSQTHVAGQESSALYAAPLAHRLVNALSAVGFYLKAMVWPVGLHFDCRAVSDLWPIGAVGNLAALGLAFVFAVWAFRRLPTNGSTGCRLPTFVFALAWFIIPLAPTLGVFGSFGIESHADRFAYLPSMAVSFVLVPFLSRPVGRRFAYVAVVVFSVLSFRQLESWRDDATAYTRTLSCDSGHPRAMVHVADALCARRHDFDGGIRLYRQALSLADTVPRGGFDSEDVKARLAYALASRGRDEDFAEVKRLGAAVLCDTRLDRRGMMLDALGSAFLHYGDTQRAASLFRASIAAPDRFWPKASTQRKLELAIGSW